MTHFGDSCHAWDVANEVMGDDATYRKSFWYAKTGTDYITTAFKTANAVKKSLGLKTKLYYNDYNTNTVNAKSTAVLEMIQTLLLDKNIGIDGMGFQSHSSYSDTATAKDMRRIWSVLLYTKLDVKTSSPTPSEDEQEQQFQVYTNVISACQQLENSAPLPWYQPNGKGTGLVRKRAYDGIAAGWKASTATSDTSSSSTKDASVQGESSLEKEPPTAASSTTDTTSDSADYESTSSSQTEVSRGSNSATQTASSDAKTASPGDAETTADGDAAASATENSDETSSTSSNNAYESDREQ
ncbi:Glycosyl hydrolase family 10 [Phytophthora infestans]|uniref:Glycosyl hydrolase family 10 n=1 Tax=Phytophthora infestans TaxID=4787 RepID=A0A833SG88_PHYIN|nr:Glycosyl hydrolase family 10 [Phytophthora infestans]